MGRTWTPHAFSLSRYYTLPNHFQLHGDGPELRDTSAVIKAGIESHYSPETNFGSNRMVQ